VLVVSPRGEPGGANFLPEAVSVKLETHECAAEGCSEACPLAHLMCVRHYRMVPAPLRRAVWTAYRTYVRCTSSTANANRLLRCVKDLRGAQTAAIAAVREKEVRKQQRIEEIQTPLGL